MYKVIASSRNQFSSTISHIHKNSFTHRQYTLIHTLKHVLTRVNTFGLSAISFPLIRLVCALHYSYAPVCLPQSFIQSRTGGDINIGFLFFNTIPSNFEIKL